MGMRKAMSDLRAHGFRYWSGSDSFRVHLYDAHDFDVGNILSDARGSLYRVESVDGQVVVLRSVEPVVLSMANVAKELVFGVKEVM